MRFRLQPGSGLNWRCTLIYPDGFEKKTSAFKKYSSRLGTTFRRLPLRSKEKLDMKMKISQWTSTAEMIKTSWKETKREKLGHAHRPKAPTTRQKFMNNWTFFCAKTEFCWSRWKLYWVILAIMIEKLSKAFETYNCLQQGFRYAFRFPARISTTFLISHVDGVWKVVLFLSKDVFLYFV